MEDNETTWNRFLMLDVRSLWNFDDPAESESRFRSALTDAEGNDRAVWLTQIARAQGLQKHFDDAHATLDLLPDFAGEPKERWEICALLERGRVLNSSGDPLGAKPLFERAALGPDIDLRIDALHMIAIVSEPDEALRINERAIAEASASDDPAARRWLGSLLNNTAWTHHELGNYARALVLFEQAVEFRREQGDVKSLRIAEWCVARCLRSLGRIDEALVTQQALVASGEDTGYMSKEIGECLLELGRANESREHFRRAYDILSKELWVEEHDPGALARMKELGFTPGT